MQNSMAIKWLHYILTSILLIVVIVSGLTWYSDSAPCNDGLYSKKELSEGRWLYITKYNNAGTTDNNIYKYYLNKSLDNLMSALPESAPFLTTNIGNVTVSATGKHITIKLTGKIYSLSNLSSFYDGSNLIMPRIDLNAFATVH